MADGVCGSVSTRVGHDRVRGGMEGLRGGVAQLEVQRIEVGRRGTVDAELGSGSSSSWLRASARKEKGEEEWRMGVANG